MGIPGIYNEIGQGERVSLAKLSIEKFEQTKRPFRIAVDIAIWNFEIQGGKGGPNPALRTLFYRLARLADTSVQAIFVFDGPERPLLKRNKVRRQGGSSYLADVQRTKLLLQLFGFESHDAPGEAEAECALLQQRGFVDAVLSEDVDTLMFGSGLTIRDWSCEGSTKTGPPTHVSLYDAKVTKAGKAGLDREGMILVALMSGGDYDTAGIVRCGAKIACEAARAGFGKSLCELPSDDASGLLAWRENLIHELHTNESHYFRQKNKSITIPSDFPKKEILRYYTHPIVSSEAALLNLRSRLQWDREIDSKRLRIFVADYFEWTGRLGAKRLVRSLSSPMLIQKLRERSKCIESGNGNLILIEAQERELVRDITGERKHFSTDGMSELRLSYQPSTIVGLDLEAEIDNESNAEQDEYLAADDDNFEIYHSDNELTGKIRSMSPIKKGLVAYDPTEICKAWVFRSIARVGVPLKVEDYEESLMLKQSLASPKKRKKAAKDTTTKCGMKKGALDRYFTTTKPLVTETTGTTSNLPTKKPSDQPQLPPVYLAPSLDSLELPPNQQAKDSLRPRREYRKLASTGDRYSQISPKPVNPWKAAQLQSSQTSSDSVANVSKSGIKLSRKESPSQTYSGSLFETTSSHDISSYPNQLSKKHSRNISPPPYISPISDTEIPTRSAHSPLAKKSRAPIQGGQEQREIRPTMESNVPSLVTKLNHSLAVDINTQHQLNLSDEDEELPPIKYLVSPSQKTSRVPLKQDGSRRAILSPTKDTKGPHNTIDLMSSSPMSQHVAPKSPEPQMANGRGSSHDIKGPQKRFIASRESLPGAWKKYTEKEMEDMERSGRGRQRWRVSQVESLDLTQD